MTINPRIKTAIDDLNAEWPGWQKLIDIDTLDMSNGGHCILGQLYQGFHHAPSHLVASKNGSGSDRLAFMTYTKAWKEYLESYLSKNGSSTVAGSNVKDVKVVFDGYSYEPFECTEAEVANLKPLLEHLSIEGAIDNYHFYKEL